MVSNATVWVRERLATAPAIYGLIVYEAVIAATSDHEPDPLIVLEISGLSLIIFFIAHVFAGVVAAHGPERLRTAIGLGFRHSVGMLYAAILPTIVLLICAAAGTTGDAASGWAVLAGLAVLAFLGYEATAERGARVWVCILGSFLTALLGLVIMVLDYLVH